MAYCIKFDNHEVFTNNYQSALVTAIALAKQYTTVQIWQGKRLVWDYNNS